MLFSSGLEICLITLSKKSPEITAVQELFKQNQEKMEKKHKKYNYLKLFRDTCFKMEDKSEQILEFLMKNSKLSLRQIAKKSGVPLTTAHNKIKKMQKEGVIKNYSVEVDYPKMGFSLCSYIMASVNYSIKQKISQQEIARRILKLGLVETADIITGEYDLMIKVRTKNIHQLNKFITKDLRNVEGVDKTTTMLVLEEIK